VESTHTAYARNVGIMTSVEEFIGKMRQLIDMERHAEIEETKCVMCKPQ